MFRTSCKLLLLGVVLIGIAATATSEAEAGSWWGCARPTFWCASPCTVPCYTPCYASSCDGWYLGWRPGPVRRLLFGPYRWYPAACCPVCSCSECCCTVTETTMAADTPTPAKPSQSTSPKKPTPAPTQKPTPDAGPAKGTPNEPAKTSGASAIELPSSDGTITLHVPADAKVVINGLKTKASGTERVYKSCNLKPGFAYDYEVRIQLNHNGELLEEVRNVRLTAGAGETFAVDFRARTNRLAQAW